VIVTAPEQVHDARGGRPLGREARLGQVRQQIDRAPGEAVGQQVLRAHDPQHVIQAVAAYREAGVAAGGDLLADFVCRVPDFQPRDLGMRRHQRVDVLVVQTKDALDHVLLVVPEDASLGALLDHDPDLFFAHGPVVGLLDAQHLQHQVGGQAQEAHQRIGEQ